MRVHPFVIPIALIVILMGMIFGAQMVGAWSVSGKTLVEDGKLSAADLKGWMTLQQVMDGLGKTKEEVYAAGGIPSDVPATTALKDLEGIVPGFEISTLRTRLAAKPGTTAPAVPAAPAAPVAPTATPTAKATPATAGTPGAKATDPAAHVTPTPLPPGQVLPADQIKGKHTLKEVSEQCAVPLDKLLAELGLAGVSPDTAIKDLIAQGKLADVTDVQKVVARLQGK